MSGSYSTSPKNLRRRPSCKSYSPQQHEKTHNAGNYSAGSCPGCSGVGLCACSGQVSGNGKSLRGNILAVVPASPFRNPRDSLVPSPCSPSCHQALNAGAPTFGTKKKTTTSSSAPSFAKAAPTKGAKPAASVSKKFGKDMTWGGRPDPTPEIIVAGASVPFASGSYEPKAPDSLGGFLEAPWRYNLRQ